MSQRDEMRRYDEEAADRRSERWSGFATRLAEFNSQMNRDRMRSYMDALLAISRREAVTDDLASEWGRPPPHT